MRAAPAQQQTLAKSVALTGRGLFHGCSARIRLLPADPGTGLRFRRVDLAQRPEIPAHVDCVSSSSRRTVLSNRDGASVETVEHLLAALAGLEVDNCVIEINAREVPAVDGSSLPFCEAILAAGLTRQHEPRAVIRIGEAQGVHDPQGEQWIEVVPSSDGTFSAGYRLDYGPGSPLPPQSFALNITPELFLKSIAGARTFVLSAEIEALREQGLGRHLTTGDLLVFEDDGTVSGGMLRWPDEPVRHKILDCLGDLALAGKCFSGHVVARRSGHKLNHVMAKTLATIGTGSLQRAA